MRPEEREQGSLCTRSGGPGGDDRRRSRGGTTLELRKAIDACVAEHTGPVRPASSSGLGAVRADSPGQPWACRARGRGRVQVPSAQIAEVIIERYRWAACRRAWTRRRATVTLTVSDPDAVVPRLGPSAGLSRSLVGCGSCSSWQTNTASTAVRAPSHPCEPSRRAHGRVGLRLTFSPSGGVEPAHTRRRQAGSSAPSKPLSRPASAAATCALSSA